MHVWMNVSAAHDLQLLWSAHLCFHRFWHIVFWQIISHQNVFPKNKFMTIILCQETGIVIRIDPCICLCVFPSMFADVMNIIFVCGPVDANSQLRSQDPDAYLCFHHFWWTSLTFSVWQRASHKNVFPPKFNLCCVHLVSWNWNWKWERMAITENDLDDIAHWSLPSKRRSSALFTTGKLLLVSHGVW